MANALSRWKSIERYVAEAEELPPLPALYISKNEKTGLSFNVSILGTCRPTKQCRKTCYGCWGPVSFPSSVKKYTQNLARLRVLETAPQCIVDNEADMIRAAALIARQDFIRWNGVGDLMPGAVRVINALALRHPDLRIWVSTRKVEQADGIASRPNVYVMLSADRTTTLGDLAAFRKHIAWRGVRGFLAYLRVAEDDIPPEDAEVVFELHIGASRASWVPDPRACAATIAMEQGGKQHANSCTDCRRCFDAATRMR